MSEAKRQKVDHQGESLRKIDLLLEASQKIENNTAIALSGERLSGFGKPNSATELAMKEVCYDGFLSKIACLCLYNNLNSLRRLNREESSCMLCGIAYEKSKNIYSCSTCGCFTCENCLVISDVQKHLRTRKMFAEHK